MFKRSKYMKFWFGAFLCPDRIRSAPKPVFVNRVASPSKIDKSEQLALENKKFESTIMKLDIDGMNTMQ